MVNATLSSKYWIVLQKFLHDFRQFHEQDSTNFKVPKFLQKQQHHQHTKVYTNKQKKKSLKIVSNQPNLHFFQNLLSKTNLHFFATQNSSFCSHLNQLLDQLHINSTRITPTIPSFHSPSKTATTLHLNEHLGATELPNTWTCKHLAPKNSETPW